MTIRFFSAFSLSFLLSLSCLYLPSSIGQDVQGFGGGSLALAPAPGVETFCVFPKSRPQFALTERDEIITGGANEILVRIKNEGEFNVTVIEIQANFLNAGFQWAFKDISAQVLNNVIVTPGSQVNVPYILVVSKFLPPGNFHFVGTIVYEIEQHPHRSTFYNGTVEFAHSLESVARYYGAFSIACAFWLFLISFIRHLLQKIWRALKVKDGNGAIDDLMEPVTQTGETRRKKKKKNKNGKRKQH